ncbi:EscI/YscI/HrpB family type III secretion system inner rod protein [Pseudomonas synxantha]|uniref:EscI/YscI/HrpB family type III secretion system inner rod protein n=1 Tax=Pseudomonas synxantha TaxID=47883 RepID=UPI000F58D39F|nr:EscI/YscI/HrpB family type III secretion system inner rod protein [Pseudomonas synxantha]
MKIDHASPSYQQTQITEQLDEVRFADANWFKAAYESRSETSGLFASLASHTLAMRQKGQQTIQKLKDTSDQPTPLAVEKSTRALSSYYLESLLTAKIIGKSTNALEKLTSLQ